MLYNNRVVHKMELKMQMNGLLLATKSLLRSHRDVLAELNSQFPATIAFLHSRGKEHMDELSSSERKELLAHLQQTYKGMLH